MQSGLAPSKHCTTVFPQDGFKFSEIGEFTTNACQMRARDLVHVGTRSALCTSQGQHGTNLLQSEPRSRECRPHGVLIPRGQLVQHVAPHRPCTPPPSWPRCPSCSNLQSSAKLPELKKTLRAVVAALRNGKLQVIALFLFLYSFSPGFGTPLYFFMIDDLNSPNPTSECLVQSRRPGDRRCPAIPMASLADESEGPPPAQHRIGHADNGFLSPASGGDDRGCGQLRKRPYDDDRHHFRTHTGRRLLSKAVRGFCICWTDVDQSLSSNAGAFLYEHLFHGKLDPLILVSAASTAVSFLLVPLLRLDANARCDDPLLEDQDSSLLMPNQFVRHDENRVMRTSRSPRD